MKKLIIIFVTFLSIINANPFKGFTLEVVSRSSFYWGAVFSDPSTPPRGIDILLTTPYSLSLFGSSKLSLQLGYGSYSYQEKFETLYETAVSDIRIPFFSLGFHSSLGKFLFIEGHFGRLSEGLGFRTSAGITLDRFMKKLPISANIGVGNFMTLDLSGFDNATYWGGPSISIKYPIGGKVDQRFGGTTSGPSAPNQTTKINKPGSTGNAKIDKFVDSSFDLNDKIIALKDKLKDVSENIAKSNEILKEIGSHPNGALGWASEQMSKGASKAVNNAKSLDVGSADALNPTQHLRKKLQTMKSGIVAGSTQLKSVPDDLKAIGNQAQTLLSSAGELPAEAKSLGFRDAPKALKAIKAASGILKNIPGEVTSLGGEAKSVVEQIDQVLKNIQSILGSA